MATPTRPRSGNCWTDLVDAWNCGDAAAFGARYRDDGSFTNVFGTLHLRT